MYYLCAIKIKHISMKHQIDKLDRKILKLISTNARTPFLEIARECNVSGAAIHQRVNKLINIGIIKGSQFIIDTYKLGYQTCAYVGVNIKDMNQFNELIVEFKNIPEIVECHYTTGKYALLLKVYAKDNKDLLNVILEKISRVENVSNTETFQLSLDEIFHRQLDVFNNYNDDDNEEELDY